MDDGLTIGGLDVLGASSLRILKGFRDEFGDIVMKESFDR